MPTYVFECSKCEGRQTSILTLEQHDTFAPVHCGKRMFQVMFAPHITADIQPYKSMITGERIRSRSHHREHLRDHGCQEVGNEKPKQRAKSAPKMSVKESLHRQLADVSDRQANDIIKREIKSRHV